MPAFAWIGTNHIAYDYSIPSLPWTTYDSVHCITKNKLYFSIKTCLPECVRISQIAIGSVASRNIICFVIQCTDHMIVHARDGIE